MSYLDDATILNYSGLQEGRWSFKIEMQAALHAILAGIQTQIIPEAMIEIFNQENACGIAEIEVNGAVDKTLMCFRLSPQ